MQHKINDVSCYVSMGCVTYDRGLGSLAAVLVAIILVVSDMLQQNVVVVVDSQVRVFLCVVLLTQCLVFY